MAESLNEFAAGYLSGVAGLIVGSPLDVLKVRLQTQASIGTSSFSATTALKTIVRDEGIYSLFKGISPPIIGLACLNSILFVSYGGIIRALQAQDAVLLAEPTLSQVFVAGFGAGVACFLVSTPTELVKCRAQIFAGADRDSSSWAIAKDIFLRNGIRGFYQGGLITALRDAPGYGVYFWCYEAMKRSLDVIPGSTQGDNLWKLLFAGGMAGVVSWASIYPLDVIKSRLQVQPSSVRVPSTAVQPASTSKTPLLSVPNWRGPSYQVGQKSYLASAVPPLPTSSAQPYTGIVDCFTRSYRAEGWGVFTRGMWPTVFRAFPVNGVIFVVYEMTMELLRTLETPA